MEFNNAAKNISWDDLSFGLTGNNPVEYIENLRHTGQLKKILPELDALFGVPQNPLYHPEVDTGIHTLMALKRSSELSQNISVRYATLVHDLGKGLTDPSLLPKHHGHEEAGVIPILEISKRLNIPDAVTELAVKVSRYHLIAHRLNKARPGKIIQLLESLEAFDKPEILDLFLLCVQSDAQGRLGMEEKPYPQARLLKSAFNILLELDRDSKNFRNMASLKILELYKTHVTI